MADTTLQVHIESAGKQDGLGIFDSCVLFLFESRPDRLHGGVTDSCVSDSRGLSVSQKGQHSSDLVKAKHNHVSVSVSTSWAPWETAAPAVLSSVLSDSSTSRRDLSQSQQRGMVAIMEHLKVTQMHLSVLGLITTCGGL